MIARMAAIGFGSFAIAAAAAAAGDAARGARVFRACAACHALEPGRNLTGPTLAGLIGRKAGGLESFLRYSSALKKSGITWTSQTLDGWLKDPQAAVPGNSMGFPGLREDRARADLIAFLQAASEGRAPAAATAPPFPDLKKASPEATIAAIRHCRDTYFVTNARGQTAPYWEFNLRFKTDSSPSGPAPGKPILVGAGMQGDRAQIVFSGPREISGFIRDEC